MRHCGIEGIVDIVPAAANTNIFGAIEINFAFPSTRMNGRDEVMKIGDRVVFDAEIINNKCKSDGIGDVGEQAGNTRVLMIALRSKMSNEMLIGKVCS